MGEDEEITLTAGQWNVIGQNIDDVYTCQKIQDAVALAKTWDETITLSFDDDEVDDVRRTIVNQGY